MFEDYFIEHLPKKNEQLVLQQNSLHQCVHYMVEIVIKIVAYRFEQLRDLIFRLP